MSKSLEGVSPRPIIVPTEFQNLSASPFEIDLSIDPPRRGRIGLLVAVDEAPVAQVLDIGIYGRPQLDTFGTEAYIALPTYSNQYHAGQAAGTAYGNTTPPQITRADLNQDGSGLTGAAKYVVTRWIDPWVKLTLEFTYSGWTGTSKIAVYYL